MNNVLPGFINTFPEKAEIPNRIPMHRYGTSSEIADVIAFLASEGAGYITGQNIRVDLALRGRSDQVRPRTGSVANRLRTLPNPIE